MQPQDYDDLDRAIFALPLAQPPADLHAAILRSTIHAYVHVVPSSVAFKTREIFALGAAIAVAVWLAVYLMFDPTFDARVVSGIGALARSLVEAQTLTWLAAGVAVALVANNTGRLKLPGGRPRDNA